MAALWAEFSEPEEGADRRGSLRRTLRLVARAAHDEIADEVLILDLSTTGLMFETSAALAASETIEVELPDVPPIAARIVWQRGAYYGCEFLQRAPVAAVSAALLRSAPKPRDTATTTPAFSWETALGDRSPMPRREPGGEGLSTIVLILLLVAVGAFILTLLTLPLSIR
jgi:hypothetical protein